jgi:hypothetical protein
MPSFPDPVTLRQLPLIAQIVRDETWLEGERRGCAVSPDDPVVRENVCAVVLRIGRELRERLTAELTARVVPAAEAAGPEAAGGHQAAA